MSENRTAKIDGPMTFGYGIDATDQATGLTLMERDFESALAAIPSG
jgi:hypothetical protein